MSSVLYRIDLEKQVIGLASNNNNIWDYYITDSEIVKMTSLQGMLLEGVGDFFSKINNLESKERNLNTLLNRVRDNASERIEEITYLCDYVSKKFLQNKEKEKEVIDQRNQEVSEKRQKMLQEMENQEIENVDLADLEFELDAAFDDLNRTCTQGINAVRQLVKEEVSNAEGKEAKPSTQSNRCLDRFDQF